MSLEELDDFERAPETHLWPEVGSRALQQLPMPRAAYNDWIEVQPRRYRYMTSQGSGLVVRMVIGEYLTGEIVWD